MGFINNSNINNTSRNRNQLHLNISENTLIIKDFSKVVNLA